MTSELQKSDKEFEWGGGDSFLLDHAKCGWNGGNKRRHNKAERLLRAPKEKKDVPGKEGKLKAKNCRNA